MKWLNNNLKVLENKLKELENLAGKELYQIVELRLCDKEGNVLIKGAIQVADIMAIELIDELDKGSVIKYFYYALEDDLKKMKNENNIRNTQA